MSQATVVVQAAPEQTRCRTAVLFETLQLTEHESRPGRSSATFLVSLLLHALLALAVAILPLLYYDSLPQQETLRAFFVTPLEMAPPPPPPPPPPSTARAAVKAPPKVQALAPQAFVAPIEVPAEVKPEEGIDFGIEGGVPGGVEGGVPGGVVGGVVGGVLGELPETPRPARVIRIGGQVAPPKLVQKVEPVYPDLALQSRVRALVILEAEVDASGHVRTVKVLRGHPLLDDAALEAVKQWRYKPLIYNGEPTAFVLSVTVNFNLRVG